MLDFFLLDFNAHGDSEIYETVDSLCFSALVEFEEKKQMRGFETKLAKSHGKRQTDTRLTEAPEYGSTVSQEFPLTTHVFGQFTVESWEKERV